MFQSVRDLFSSTLNLLLSNLLGIVASLNEAKGNISVKFLLRDVYAILVSTGLIFIFQVLALLVFIMLPQGQDVIMVAVDTMGDYFVPGNVLGLVIGTVAWSIFSEFAVRYAIYVTDNSGNSLSQQRVVWRKAVQQAVADIFLLSPYIIILISLWVNYDRLSADDQSKYQTNFITAGCIIYILMIVVSQIYFAGRNAQKRMDARNALGTQPSTNWLGKILDDLDGWCYRVYTRYFPNTDERAWLEKLQGIYNDYVFRIHKHTHFAGEMEDEARRMQGVFLRLPEPQRHYFPQNTQHMSSEGKVPASFRLRAFTTDGLDINDPVHTPGLKGGYFKWQYHIPLSFYKRTHQWLYAFIGISVAWMLIILFLNVEYYDTIGSPALLLGAFCSWTGIYMGVLFLDFGILRRGTPLRPGSPRQLAPKYARGWRGGAGLVDFMRRNISIRSLLLVWLLLASYYNTDHPIRYYLPEEMEVADRTCCKRPDMHDHFTRWVENYTADSSYKFYDTRNPADSQGFWPITFVCAEGGAIRTGAFTTMMLATLQDNLPQVQKAGFDFSKTIYGCSGVSGGSLGLMTFNALAYVDKNSWEQGRMHETVKQFYNEDYLSAVLGKLFYGEILQLWWPWHVQSLDRVIGLEKSLEKGYADHTGRATTFSDDFLKIYHEDHQLPALFINTTEVETGLQCWLSSVRPDPDMLYAKERDLYESRLPRSVRVATAVNFSTRFPIFSPAACVIQGASSKRHYVDGGYVENSGAATMLEMLHALAPLIDTYKKKGIIIRPNVLMMRFEEDNTALQNVSFGNELMEIINGIYNTRSGRFTLARAAMRRYVEDKNGLNGNVVELQLRPDGKAIPMSWVFSQNSINKLDTFVNSVWKDRNKNNLHSLAYIDTANFKKATLIRR